MNQSQRAAKAVERMMHDAHLRYQRSMLTPQAQDKACVVTLECAEVRGCRVRSMPHQTFKPEWFTHLRPNFWKAYFDTLLGS